MSGEEPVIPDVTDQDIEWVQSLLGVDAFDRPRVDFLKRRSTVDLSACPGSGKTTLVVAKLAILARKWPYRTKGICVLSHTNVAREQIETRLGGTVVGQRLLSYPHFVDTIHGFVNRFLALPWLYSNGYPSPTIDDDVTTAYRRSVLGRADYWTVEHFLKQKNTAFDRLRICGRDLSFDLGGKPFPAGRSAASFEHAERAVHAAAREGYFCYEEMFVWGNALMEDQKDLPIWMANRFPMVLIDEMQDTSAGQASLLNGVIPRNWKRIVVQRVGDPNQRIFDVDALLGSTEQYPDMDRCLDIPNSYRFGSGIASLASPFAVRPVGRNGLCGIGEDGVGCRRDRHAIFVLPDERTSGILEAFGTHAIDVLGERRVRQGLVAAIGHIHNRDAVVGPGHPHYPKSLGDYWSGYAGGDSKGERHPLSFVEYVWLAQGVLGEGSSFSPGVEKIASATVALARRLGEIGDLKRRGRTHRAVVEALRGDDAAVAAYRAMVKRFLIDRGSFSEDDWRVDKECVISVAASLCKGTVDRSKAERFLRWPEGDSPTGGAGSILSGGAVPNVYRVRVGGAAVDIRLGSIHSVKGQTHVATLLLSTYWHDHSAKRLMPWLVGDMSNGDGAGIQDTHRLLHTYVGMTRASDLLCLAVPRQSLRGQGTADDTIAKLMERGWEVGEVDDGTVQWRRQGDAAVELRRAAVRNVGRGQAEAVGY